MSVNISLLLQAHGIEIVSGNRRAEVMLELGQAIKIVDQNGNQLMMTLKDRQLHFTEMSGSPSYDIMVKRHTVDPVLITTVAGVKMELRPIAMSHIPSEDPQAWLRFIGPHVPGTSLNEIEQKRLQKYLRLHHTEAVTDGQDVFTLAGDMLAHCNPSQQ
ncbi:hypothetical protein H8F21_13940 [Pseudomonas sp. P66]|uniref:Uncharacterized protein n=1 Tax=Pseudomonas arcuscaelestis TaxID=2710591 RepID=A0ABS2BYH2_9PSED|nr:hypothetical protein [Pseudomonas arcuscaelestis]MBM5458667.1 hypothetical protein [Pseudomonas arcuscaelestis]